MGIRLNQIITYEKRLMANRKQLLELMEECNLNEKQESELLTHKLESFQKELQYLERQTYLLKSVVKASNWGAVPRMPRILHSCSNST